MSTVPFAHSDIDLKHQTVEVPGSREAGASAIIRHPFANPDLSIDDGSGVKTLYENFEHGLKRTPNSKLLGHRPLDPATGIHANHFVWQSYAEAGRRRTNLGSGLLHLHEELIPGERSTGWHLGIYSANRPEWFLSEQACNAYSLVSIALYDTLGPDATEYIVNHATIPMIIASSEKIPLLLSKAHLLPSLRVIVSMDDLGPATSGTALPAPTLRSTIDAWSLRTGVRVLEFTEVEALGADHPRAHVPPKPTDVCTICYTSGTTGNPKGVLSTHQNYIASSMGGGDIIRVTEADTHISYLPLAHCMERCTQAVMVRWGACIGFHSGDVARLMEDMAILRPTLFPSVPRLLNRLYDKLSAATIYAPGLKGALIRRAYDTKIRAMRAGEGNTHALYDRLLFSKVRAILGGRVRFILTGSAPISPAVLEFLRATFSCTIVEGYGQTENAAACCVTVPGDFAEGRVGVPIRCNEIRLLDVPEMEYLSTDLPCPRGEICTRGINVFSGYYREPEKTAEALGEDGWLRTGDIGRINPDGTISIIDRKKNIFKLSQGEYVAPDKVENVYKLCPYVENIYVHGDSLESALVAVVSPDPEEFLPWARRISKNAGATSAELITSPVILAALLAELDKTGKAEKLRGFEFARAVRLIPDAFTVANGTLTPTLKLKRNDCAKLYRAEIDAMYAGFKTSPPRETAKL